MGRQPGQLLVQIPLWSMNTIRGTGTGEVFVCSDSSMVDEYGGDGMSFYKTTKVQIPLWSMNTRRSGMCRGSTHTFRFLYGRWILGEVLLPVITPLCSDSSMVDEYLILLALSSLYYIVQIPLWSMNTIVRGLWNGISSSSDSSMVDEYQFIFP